MKNTLFFNVFQKLGLVFLLCLASTAIQAQTSFYLSKKEAQQDLAFFDASIHEYQAAFGVFHDTASYRKLYDYIWEGLPDSISMLNFHAHIVRLGAEMREGHLIVDNTADSTKSVFQGFFNNSYHFLPLHVKYLEGGVRVWGNFSPDSALQRGDRLVSINGAKLEDIIRYLTAYTITDAHILSAKRIKLMANFASHYFLFAERPKEFKLVYQPYGQEQTRQVTLPAISRDSMVVWSNKRYGSTEVITTVDSNNIYEWKLEEDYGYLNLKDFGHDLQKQLKIKPKTIYKAIFKELQEKEIKHLIIDVRNNLGGRTEYVNEVLPFLLQEKTKGIAYQTTSWKGKVKKNKFPKPSKWAFEGEVYVLTNGASFSNGSVAAAYAKAYAAAIIIGEETGSRVAGFAAGSRELVTLPNSTIQIKIPSYLFQYGYPPNEWIVANRGLMPDYEIKYTLEDLIQKKDLALEKARTLITN